MVEDMEAVLVEDVGWAKEGHHVEECVLVLMYQCRGRERARQEVKGWGWSPGWRRWSLCRVSLLWTERTFISAGESRREARPLNNLGAE